MPGVAFQQQIYAKMGQTQGDAFIQRVNQMGSQLNVDPNWILGNMYTETSGTFSTSIRNGKGSGATGLIQFTPVTAVGLGTSTTALAQMDPVTQCDYVQQYYQNQINSFGQPQSYGDMYSLVVDPSVIGKSDDSVIWSSSSTPKTYAQNQNIDTNGDGVITAGEIRAYSTSTIPSSQQAYLNTTSVTITTTAAPSITPNVDPPLSLDKNYTSGNTYPTNSIDTRIGTGFSNLQQLGNGMPAKQEYRGAPSVFNDYALFRYYGINDVNDLYDRNGSSSRTYDSGNKNGSGRYISSQWKNPSATILIEQSTKTGYKQFPYNWTDFLYAKDFGIIPNNRLITLRRYPLPTYDHGLISSATQSGKVFITGTRENAFQLPVAQAITYFGDDTDNKVEEIMNFTVGMNWKKQTADINQVRPQVQGSDSTSGGIGKFSAVLGILTGQANGYTISGEASQYSQYDPYDSQNGPLKYKVYGPVNVIDETYTRDRGLTMDQEFAISFTYSLRSLGEINPKMAMLDILANMLSLTYNNAKFWGGANRFFPNTPAYPFIGSQSLWFNRDPGNYVGSVLKQMGGALKGIEDFFSLFSGNPTQALQKLLSQGSDIGMGMLQHGHRPDILSIPSLLTGQPVGEWHLVIGNPLNPTLMIGNLICKGMDVKFNNRMGADDFPTEMTCVIRLSHGRPRDKGDIESMFNQGQGRLYYAYQNALEPWNKTSSTRNSTNSTTGATSSTGLAKDAVTWGGKSKNTGNTDINQSIRNAMSVGGVNLNNNVGRKFYQSGDNSDLKAYQNAEKDGGGSN